MASILAILLTAAGFFLIAVVVTMYATGLAQSHVLPLIQARVDTVMNGLPFVGNEAVDEEVAPPQRGRTPADSLQALVTQLETEATFLATRSEVLDRQRAQIDSVVTALQSIQSEEVLRQAKLYAAMKPDEAARILYSLDDPTLVAVLKNMNARAASKIMGRLDPRRLARLSMEGIGRPQLADMDLSEAGAIR
jgi:hypothetical protein